jgi:adenine phosphoribosyltransferase
MSKETLAKSIREIPDFPIPGILFYDVTTLFKEPAALQELSDTLYEMYKDKGITKVVGIESRGFIMGPILATRLGAGFVPIRKPGKLPAETIEESSWVVSPSGSRKSWCCGLSGKVTILVSILGQ